MIAAKEEKEDTLRKYGVLTCSLLDVFTVVLFAIPIYGNGAAFPWAVQLFAG